MKRLALLSGLLLAGQTAWAIINPSFTPKHLVEQADTVFSGRLEAGAKPTQWALVRTGQIKGKSAAKHSLSLDNCEKDHVNDIAAALKANGKGPVVLYCGEMNEEKRAYLHVAGMWLNVKPVKGDSWQVTGYAPQMSGTYAGGTDMLIRMSKYLAADPDGEVPVTAGVAWVDEGVKIGKAAGEVSALAAVEIGKINSLHLFVGSPAGDRLYKPVEKDDETTFTDVTAASGLDSKSRKFAWVDVDRDGLADLVSFDGEALSVRLAGSDGKFKPAAKGFGLKLDTGCEALAACSMSGSPGVLVSTYSAPVLLSAGKAGWTKVPMPAIGDAGGAIGQAAACIVADVDRDGLVDVLQPGSDGGLLWRGKAGGVAAPVKTAVSAGGGRASVAVADFNEDGALDVFIAGAQRNSLWEGDGKGGFKNVFRHSGSMSYKCPPGAAATAAMDLNHDGRADICLIYAAGDILYHFNRGFRAMGEEGEVRLPGLASLPGQPRLGQKAMTTGDFNGDGAQDLVVLVSDGRLLCYINDKWEMPGLRLRLPKGVTGPVTVSCWQGEKYPICTGTVSVPGHSPAAYVAARYRGRCSVKWTIPGQGEQVKKVTVGDAALDVTIAPAAGKTNKK